MSQIRTFAEALKEARGTKTQVEVSQDLNLSRSSLANWESGTREPDFATLKKLCEYYRVSADALLGIDGVPSSTNVSDSNWRSRYLVAQRKLDKVNEALGKVIEGTKALQEAVK